MTLGSPHRTQRQTAKISSRCTPQSTVKPSVKLFALSNKLSNTICFSITINEISFFSSFDVFTVVQLSNITKSLAKLILDYYMCHFTQQFSSKFWPTKQTPQLKHAPYSPNLSSYVICLFLKLNRYLKGLFLNDTFQRHLKDTFQSRFHPFTGHEGP